MQKPSIYQVVAMVRLLMAHHDKVFSAPQNSRPKTCIFCFLIDEVRATTDLESPGIETRFVVKMCSWLECHFHKHTLAVIGFAGVSGTCFWCDLVLLHSLCIHKGIHIHAVYMSQFEEFDYSKNLECVAAVDTFVPLVMKSSLSFKVVFHTSDSQCLERSL